MYIVWFFKTQYSALHSITGIKELRVRTCYVADIVLYIVGDWRGPRHNTYYSGQVNLCWWWWWCILGDFTFWLDL